MANKEPEISPKLAWWSKIVVTPFLIQSRTVAYAQAFVGLVVNSPGSECKIADVLSGTIISETLDQSHWSSFYNLVKYVLEWVGKRIDDLHFALAKEYEKLEYEEIINLENVNFTVPTTDKAFKSRNL